MTSPGAGNASDRLFPVWLLRSKVSPTRQRVDLLERPSHTLKLQQALDASLSLIHAPAGYGKSTLLSNWRAVLLEEGHRVAWLSLGQQDNDPVQLLTYIAFALSEAGLEFNDGEGGFDHPFGDLSVRDFLSIVIHFVAEANDRVVLILDDFENLGVAVIDEVIRPLLEYAPDNLHVAIATRDDKHLKISNLEAKGRAVRFGAQQIKFTPMELSDFLGEEYDNQTIQRLYQVTEGWPVAVQMIRSAIQAENDVERLLNNLAAEGTSIASYLSEEILAALDPALCDFLMDVSLVDRVDCEFADFLRGEIDSHNLFNQARVLDTLVLPLDTVETTYRLHPLFREHLYDRRQMTDPARLQSLHHRAADWFSDRGDLVEAVRHCILGGDPGHAADIIARAGGVMIWFIEGLSRLRAVMRLVDEETVSAHWKLGMIRCLLDIKDGKVSEARRLFDRITAQPEIQETGAAQAGWPSKIHEVSVMGMLLAIYEGKQISRADCRKLEETLAGLTDDQSSVKSNLLTFLCIANLQRGKFSEGRKFGELAIAAFRATGSLYGEAYIHFHMGDISFAEGDSEGARDSYRKGLAISRKHFNDDQSMKLVARILIEELDYELNDQGKISGMLSVPKQLEKNEAWFDIYAAGYTTAAHRVFDNDGLEGAESIVTQARRYAQRNNLQRLIRFLVFLRIDLLLRADEPGRARAVLEDAGIDMQEYRDSSRHQIAWRERDAAVHAATRLLMKEGRHGEALDWLEHFAELARTEGNVRAGMTYNILIAIAHHRLDNAEQRTRHLDEALVLFEKSRFIRPFIHEKEELAAILRAHLTEGETVGLRVGARRGVESILSNFEDAGGDRDVDAVLSQRESEVLQQLVHGHSNKVIARNMDVSESTVRFHLRNIFAKLNVKSRLQAVSVARQKNLIRP